MGAAPILGGPASQAAAQQQGAAIREFIYSGGESGRREVEAAIDRATENMNVLIRGLARRKLREANDILPTLAFAVDATTISVRYVEGRWIAAPSDGSAVRWTDQYGEDISVQHRIRGQVVTQILRGSGGTRTNVYEFGDGGKELRMGVVIESPRLPEPVRYQVRYRLHAPL